jgi:hypothetical protein
MCINWTNKEFDIINARYNYEEEVDTSLALFAPFAAFSNLPFVTALI